MKVAGMDPRPKHRHKLFRRLQVRDVALEQRVQEPLKDWIRRGWLTRDGRMRKHVARNPRDRRDLRARMRQALEERQEE